MKKEQNEGSEDAATLGLAKDLQGHRHLLTFVDGPRMCLGRMFALAEFKVSSYLFMICITGS